MSIYDIKYIRDFLNNYYNKNEVNSLNSQVKSKKRVADHGEVFTNQKEVDAMCDMVIQETERIDSRFLEPACGDGNFLIEILKRKLNIVKKKYKKSIYDYERFSLLAISSLYGVELLEDNVVECRNRLYNYWHNEYKAISKKEYDEKVSDSAKYILERNIVCGNALSLKCVDKKGNDIDTPIIFSEWTFPFNDTRIQRKDYTLDELVKRDSKQQEMNDVNEEGKFLKQYITHYKKLND